MGLIYILDSEKMFSQDLKSFLISEQQDVVIFDSCKELTFATENVSPDLIILDPVVNEFAGFIWIKKNKTDFFSFIFLSSQASTSDRILGLEIGAADYIPLTTPQKEIYLRIKNVLKRICPEQVFNKTMQSWTFENNEIVFNLDNYKLFLNGEEIKFTKSEWNIFYLLCLNCSIGVSREKIISECLQKKKNGYARIVDGHIKKIRAKLNLPKAIIVMRGYGYMFVGNKT